MPPTQRELKPSSSRKAHLLTGQDTSFILIEPVPYARFAKFRPSLAGV